MATIERLKRVFVAGSTRLADPAPNEPLQTAVRMLAQNYPMFRWSSLFEEDGIVEGDSLVFSLQLPPPKING